MVKLKIDFLSVSIIFLESALRWKLFICYLFRRALFEQPNIIKSKCKATFSTKFMALKRKVDTCGQCFPDKQLLSFSNLYIDHVNKKESVKRLTRLNLGNWKRKSMHSMFRLTQWKRFQKDSFMSTSHSILLNKYAFCKTVAAFHMCSLGQLKCLDLVN